MAKKHYGILSVGMYCMCLYEINIMLRVIKTA